MIKMCSISKSYHGHPVLTDLNLSVAKGSITGIVGPNACGKTTLIKCLLGLVIPDSGEVWIDGKKTDPKGNFRREIGYMPQTPTYPGNLCLRELLEMLQDLRKETAPSRQELVQYFNLETILKQPLDQLSGGTRQKVAAVIAFMFGAPLIVLDEPTVGLDPLSAVKFKDLVLRKSKEGKTILLISHIMAEVDQLATDMAFVNEGKIAFSGPLEELLKQTNSTHLDRAVTRLFEAHKERQ